VKSIGALSGDNTSDSAPIFLGNSEIEKAMTRAKTWFDQLTNLSKVEGQSMPSDGHRAVIPSDGLCENSKGALRHSSGRTAKYLISVCLTSVRGEPGRTMNGVFTQSGEGEGSKKDFSLRSK
jgi:hypothetical protein